MKQLGVLLHVLTPGLDVSPSQGCPPTVCLQNPFIHLGEETQCGAELLVYGNNTAMQRPTRPRTTDPQIFQSSDQKSDALTTTPSRPYRPLSLGGHVESRGNKKLCFHTASLGQTRIQCNACHAKTKPFILLRLNMTAV